MKNKHEETCKGPHSATSDDACGLYAVAALNRYGRPTSLFTTACQQAVDCAVTPTVYTEARLKRIQNTGHTSLCVISFPIHNSSDDKKHIHVKKAPSLSKKVASTNISCPHRHHVPHRDPFRFISNLPHASNTLSVYKSGMLQRGGKFSCTLCLCVLVCVFLVNREEFT